jgi:hypothetical protein
VLATPMPFDFQEPIGYCLEELPEAWRFERQRPAGVVRYEKLCESLFTIVQHKAMGVNEICRVKRVNIIDLHAAIREAHSAFSGQQITSSQVTCLSHSPPTSRADFGPSLVVSSVYAVSIVSSSTPITWARSDKRLYGPNPTQVTHSA